MSAEIHNRPLVELMGGRCIDVDLEGAEIPERVGPAGGRHATPSNDKLAFLKNLTRHMIGMNSPAADTAIVDNLLTDAIVATYQLSAFNLRECARRGFQAP